MRVASDMKAFGYLSFGHYRESGRPGGDAREALKQAVELAEAADEIGVNGAYLRVHHFEKQQAAPMPVLSAMAARTKRIEVGTGVIDMRYENPWYLAEEAAALDLLADGRLALGVSRGSPGTAYRGWESFGYTGDEDARGANLGREHFERFLDAVRGGAVGTTDPAMTGVSMPLRIEPRSLDLDHRIWWGAGTRQSAQWAAEMGVNLMSSTLVTEAEGGRSFGDLQREQIDRYRAAFKAAGHDRTPRVSVSRSIFPIVTDDDRRVFGLLGRSDSDQVGVIDGFTLTFGKTYVGEPDELIEELRADAAIEAADTVMLTIPNQLGVDYNSMLLESFAKYVAPSLGWKPNTEGPVEGYAI